MTPIEHRVDTAFLQALNCAEHRIPRDPRLQQSAFVLALGIRYGLIGAAATHQLFTTTDESEIAAVRNATKDWEQLVAAHVRLNMMRRLPVGRGAIDHDQVARYSDQTLHEYLTGYYRGCDLTACLDGVIRVMSGRYRSEVSRGWPWHRALGARRLFSAACTESVRFATLFLDRRLAGLEELPEIAILGE